VVELRYAGGEVPDLSRVAAAFGAGVRLLHGSLDRIQGHTQGALLLSIPAHAALEAAVASAGAIAHHVTTLGYVSDTH
jgi:D-methionine transport system ATP-binding protein